jgi:hypothetical protein
VPPPPGAVERLLGRILGLGHATQHALGLAPAQVAQGFPVPFRLPIVVD